MGFLPTEYEDTLWFLLAPITTIPMAVYAASGLTYGSYPYGKPDIRASIRNSVIWTGMATAIYGWNQYYHPGKYAFMTGSQAFRTAGHLVVNPVTVGAAIATAAAIAYVATADQHGGATGMLVGDMNMGLPVTQHGQPAGGSSSNIFPGMEFSDFLPWNW
jgi:hypothetical protein